MRTLTVSIAAALLGLSGLAMADGANRHISLDNQASQAVVQIFASSVGTNSWEEDILGVDVLPAGTSVDILVDDGSGECSFDFKIVYEDGDEATLAGVNVCEESTLTATD